MSLITDYHAKYYAWELGKRHPIDSTEKFAGAVANAQVDLNPHQVDAALFAFKSPLSKGAILADEVGLGKTIEAGLVLSQKWAEKKRRILIITPANLRKQWNQELLEKFFLPSVILESKSYKGAVALGNRRPFLIKDEIVICSYHFARDKEADIAQIQWDLVVIDEAHRLRNVYKKDNKIANTLKDALKDSPKILLTATPLQNSLLELYGLVSIIDEHVFGNLKSFREQYGNLKLDQPFHDLKRRLQPVCHRTLRKQVMQYVPYTKRTAIVERFTPAEKEQELYNEVTEYLARPNLEALPSGQRSLITLILRKLLASSTFAIAGALRTMADRLANTLLDQEKRGNMIQAFEADVDGLVEAEEEWEVGEDETSPALSAMQRVAMQVEKEDLERYLALAESVTKNAKGEKLLTGLEKAFEKATNLGASRKAIIFTESRKTQDYLVRLLTLDAYSSGEIVLFNGTNSDPRSREIYNAWLQRHKGTDRVTGSPTADMRSAIVDYFKEEATIMIATEAGAEGINLQFCSLVVNYDLPWNPQRIEQRIGRCHRYGQAHDVVVLNFLNTENAADERVYKILDEKFKLFEGVFGASDEILGSIGSGVDFENRIAEIYRTCRTTSAIQAQFDLLQAELRDEINEEMRETRTRLIENFDEEVREKLKSLDEASRGALKQHERLLMTVTEHVLAGFAEFDRDGGFNLLDLPLGLADRTDIPLGRYELPRRSKEAHLYRPEHPLARWVRAAATERPSPAATLLLDYAGYEGNIAAIEPLVGNSGWLLMKGLTVEAMELTEDYLLTAVMTDSGEVYPPEDAARLLKVNGQVLADEPVDAQAIEAIRPRLEAVLSPQVAEFLEKIEGRNSKFFDAEVNKLESWADDRKSTLEAEIREVDRRIKEARRAATASLPLKEKLEGQKRVGELEKERNRLRRELFATQDQIDEERDALIADVAGKLEQRVVQEELFLIRWRLR
ncbi:MAG: DEAD/DEAH box helicase family protein [Bacteroidetes bacterium]|nr:DEAD/DEAH box helicase family protein [Bacteroidota bacterium]